MNICSKNITVVVIMVGKATDTRLEILAFVVAHLENNRFGPTRAEIAEGVGLKVRSSVQYHVESLVEDGYLERSVYRHRMLKPTQRGIDVVNTLRTVDAEADSTQ